ncbi:MAG: YfhO family protein [Bacillota bacterium]|nr:YfhO family protein [Bacillota bacterium]
MMETLNNTKPHLFRQIAIYSALFILIAAGVYYVFIAGDKTLLRYCIDNKDGLSQRYMFLFEFKRFLEGLFAGGQINTWDWSIGIGADAYQFNVASLFNPLNYIAVIFPAKFVDVAYSFSVVLRIYLSGFAFLLFGYKVRLTDFQAIIGSLAYSFSPWLIVTSVSQGHFMIATILLPLVLLGAEKILQGESPVLFMVMVAYTLLVSLQWAYIIGLISVPYFILRYFTQYNDRKASLFFKKLGLFIFYGLVGIVTSAMGFMMTALRFGGATIESSIDIPTLFTMDDYLRLPSKLTAWGAIFSNYSYIGVTAVCMAMIPVIVFCIFKRRTPAIMTALLIIGVCIPEVSSAFNFFSYMTGRWMFVLSFFFAWAAAECFDARYLSNKWIKISILGTYILYGLYMVWFRHQMEDISVRIAFINCLATGIIIVIVLIMYSRFALQRKTLYRLGTVAVTGVLAVSLITAYNLKMESYPEGNLKIGEAQSLLQASPQRVAAEIKDDDFFRVDQIDGISTKRELESDVNETMYFGTRSVYEFSSSIDTDWLEFHKLLGNNAGYYKRTSPNSNDNRAGIDLLLGVRYFIGNDVNGPAGASDYAGYGFNKDKTIDGVDVLKSKYSIGLGTVYDSYIKRSEWMKLTEHEREQALLQAAVVDDDFAAKEVSEKTAADIETDVRDMDYQFSGTTDCEIDEDQNVIYVSDTMGGFDIRTKNAPAGQLMVTLEGIHTPDPDDRCWIYVSDGKIRKTIANTSSSEQGLTGMTCYSVNMGYTKGGTCDISVRFLDSNAYQFDAIKVSVMSTDLYEKYAEGLQANRLVCHEIESDHVEGKINSPKGGILYMSILDDNGWEIRVDGKKAEKINGTNVAFTGVEVGPGSHEITLDYHTEGLRAGILATLAGLILIIITGIVCMRRGRNDR